MPKPDWSKWGYPIVAVVLMVAVFLWVLVFDK